MLNIEFDTDEAIDRTFTFLEEQGQIINDKVAGAVVEFFYTLSEGFEKINDYFE